MRAASRLVGRRTTLRYLAVGVGASLLAACKGNDKAQSDGSEDRSGDGTGGGTGGGGSSPGPSGVTGRAFAAFVRGTWKVTSTMPGASGESYSSSVTVDGGTWSMDSGGGEPSKGTWSLQGTRLEMRVPKHPGEDELHDTAADNVPATIGDSVSVGLPWQPPGASGTASSERLEVDYNEKAGLRIRHFDAHGSMTVHQCVRA
ncbi:hypothetical protein [Streptomyces sp. NPDC059142]|uniref:hypothetical protein n=1 Tax=Streptomyces sp. NPDC059142 TaxID=3346739 RepID=UPI0036BF3810